MGLTGHIGKTLAAIAFTLLAAPLWGQNQGVVQSQIVTVDSEVVFSSTAVGQGITTDLEDQVRALAAENLEIAAELEAEELALTERRAGIQPDEFRELADDFDRKVRRVRVEQDAKQRELQRLRDAERQSFVDAIGPILSRIARRHGALVVMERRNVLLSADSIDITQEVVKAIDAELRANSGTVPGVTEDAQIGGAVEEQSK